MSGINLCECLSIFLSFLFGMKIAITSCHVVSLIDSVVKITSANCIHFHVCMCKGSIEFSSFQICPIHCVYFDILFTYLLSIWDNRGALCRSKDFSWICIKRNPCVYCSKGQLAELLVLYLLDTGILLIRYGQWLIWWIRGKFNQHNITSNNWIQKSSPWLTGKLFENGFFGCWKFNLFAVHIYWRKTCCLKNHIQVAWTIYPEPLLLPLFFPKSKWIFMLSDIFT